MPEAKRPNPRRRSTADARAKKPSRPGRSGDAGRGKPRASKEIAKVGGTPAGTDVPRGANTAAGDEGVVLGDSIRDSIAAAAERASEQRFGSAARRAAILAAVICVLTLTIAGPVRTYFGQRTEMMQIKAAETQLREQIAELEQQKQKLADPVFIAAQARERLGFVMPGEIPYQVQLPPGAAPPGAPPDVAAPINNGDPWYTALWQTIAEAPHPIASTAPQTPPDVSQPVPPSTPPPGG